MVPRLRHRIGIETLRRELDAVHAAAAANPSTRHHRHNSSSSSTIITPPSSSTSTITAEEAWAINGCLSVQAETSSNSYFPKHHHNAAVGDKIPGYRTSAAFLSSLRTNLRLHASPPPSPMSTPPSMRASMTSLPDGGAPSPSPLNPDLDMATLTPPETPTNPLDGVPELGTYITTSEDEKIKALKLLSDSIAQMRQTASSILIFHPLNLAVFVVVLAAICSRFYNDKSDSGIAFTTAAGISMGTLVFIRWLTGPYLFEAEDYAKAGLQVLDGADVIVTKFGDEIIGALVLGWKGVQPGGSPKDSQRGKRRKWRAEIKGWAVRIRYRGKGIGGDLLEEAVSLAKSKGAESVSFAEDHANSKRILWDMYNSAFDKNEKLARDKLQALWEANPKGRKR